MKMTAVIVIALSFFAGEASAYQLTPGDEWDWSWEHTRTPSHFRYASHGKWYSFSHSRNCLVTQGPDSPYGYYDCSGRRYRRPHWRYR